MGRSSGPGPAAIIVNDGNVLVRLDKSICALTACALDSSTVASQWDNSRTKPRTHAGP